MAEQLYVETEIRTPMAVLWARTQDPAEHQRWDLRFGEIVALPAAAGGPQRFRYRTRLLPGVSIDGTGLHAGERRRPDGGCTSALRFASGHPLSPIREGSGYWRYQPGAASVRFLTGYDYRPRWGAPGRVLDRLLFRPLMGWATAWSFDRLRIWLERGVAPERSRNQALVEVALRASAIAVGALVGPRSAAGAALLAVLLPPLPSTPAARRCRRTARPEARAPRVALTLEETR